MSTSSGPKTKNQSQKNLLQLTAEEKDEMNGYLEEKGLPTNVAVTFSDVALPDRYSTVRSRSEIYDFRSTLADGLDLNIPIVSANMESVTGVELATALAREGGIGFVPQMIPFDERIEMIELVRRTDSAFVDQPLTISPDETLGEAKKLMNKFGIMSLVVVNKKKEPVGILSTRDWRYEDDDSRLVKELMGGKKKLITAPRNVSRDEAAELLKKNRIEKLPLVDDKGKLTGLVTAHGLFYEMRNPRALRDDQGRFLVAGSVGVGRKFEKKQMKEIEAQVKAGISALLIDTARAYSVNAVEALDAIKAEFPKLPLIVGNVCTPEGAKFLFEHGAHAVKVNQGRGHVCTTSHVGVGIPQLTAIAKCSAIARKYNGRVVGDGGMKSAGDMVKAIAAGADTLMTGYTLIGTHESAAETYLNLDGLPVKNYEGSASFQAQKKRIASGTLDRMRRPEGMTRVVPVVGSVKDVIGDIIDAFKSAMSYSGVRTLNELREVAKFELQTGAGLFEGMKK